MYRAVTLYALDHGMIDSENRPDASAVIAALPEIAIDFAVMPDGSQRTLLNEAVSPVAAIPEVRHALVAKQKALGAEKGIVMDGRDIGTVVFPDAELKIFVDASAETRAMRRFREMMEKGAHVNYEEVLANVVHRDKIDTTRAESPLRRADDALSLDNSAMTLDEQDAWLLEQYKRAAE